MEKFLKIAIVVFSLMMLGACQSSQPKAGLTVSAASLSDEYAQSRSAVRNRYEGKEIIVRGYAPTGSRLPRSDGEQGSVLMYERGREASKAIVCWFSPQQAAAFSKIKGGELLIVKGVFNGETRPELRFCKLIGLE
jgi:putative nucleic acid binding protein